MKRKAECPTCNVNLLTGGGGGGGYERNILANRHLESVVDLYREKVRGELRQSLVRLSELERKEQEQKQQEDSGDGEEEQKVAAVSSSKRARRSTANYKREYSSEDQEDGNDDEEAEGDGTMTLNTSSDVIGGTLLAAAPPPAAAAVSSYTTNAQQQQRKRKPPISYHNLKRPKLIQLLKSSNLPTNGTDSELQHRHSEYILLYNSQCDSAHPMSEQEVIATILKEEKGRKRERVEALKSGASRHEGYMKRLVESVTSRNNDDGENNVVTTGSKRLDGEMKNNFKEMIEKVKARKKGDDATKSSTGERKCVPSCIAAAAATVDAAENGSNALSSKARAKSDTVVAASVAGAVAANDIASAATAIAAPTMKATTSSSIRTTTTTTAASTATRTRQKSITNNIPKSKSTTPAKSRTTLKKQATLSTKPSSTTKVKSSGIWKCPTCTFENHKYITATAICEMCSMPRPEKENGRENEVIAIDC